MIKRTAARIASACVFALAAVAASAPAFAAGSCTTLVTGLRVPLGTALTPQGNLLVSESGAGAPHSGRISIVGADGSRRTLLDGLPSAPNDVGDPSGPAGLYLRGRTLFVAIGAGDVGILGVNGAGEPLRGTDLPNPNGPSSPLFSSVLALQFSTDVERGEGGFALSGADEQALAAGASVVLSNSGGDTMKIERIVDFPNYVPAPRPNLPTNVALSNPFGLIALDDALYVTDGGRNLVWKVDLLTRSLAPLVGFAPVPNPLFGIVGGPFIEAVPTGIASRNGLLYVTLFRGAPFPPGVSSVQQIDPSTGTATSFIGGLKTAIDVLPWSGADATPFFVLEHASSGLFFGTPGVLLRFDAPSAAPSVVADCLWQPSSMSLDRKTGTLYVSEVGGALKKLSITP
jgi:hypothetical protein